MPLHLTLVEALWLFADGILLGLGWLVANGVAWLIGTLFARRNTTP